MAFIKQGTTVISFAEYSDVLSADQRMFDSNEGLTDDVIESHLIRSTERILTMIRATDWWVTLTGSLTTNSSPAVVGAQILDRKNDFTDLCVYYALCTYIYPTIADFSNPDNAERAKIGFYQQKFQALFDELISNGGWYDLNNDGTVSSDEKKKGYITLKRVR
jgi:hypothetical protein